MAGRGVLLFVKNLVFTIVVPGAAAVYVPLFVFPHDPATVSVTSALAVLLLVSGTLVYLWCLWDFATYGRGTPAPIDPPRQLVIRGLYRYSRNPMYLGVSSVIFGWSLLFQSMGLATYGIVIAVLFHLFVVFYEEPHLRQVFGADYEQYCARVGRWFPFRRSAGS
jgi:protein-S-isoprenylcysteine O-methyltransferase Ste14